MSEATLWSSVNWPIGHDGNDHPDRVDRFSVDPRFDGSRIAQIEMVRPTEFDGRVGAVELERPLPAETNPFCAVDLSMCVVASGTMMAFSVCWAIRKLSMPTV